MRARVVDIWLAPARAVGAAVLVVLDDGERARAAGLPEAAAAGFVVGRALARSVVGDRLGVAPREVRLDAACPVCGGPHGPVEVRGAGAPWRVSISRASGLVAVALSAAAPVGVDVEEARSVRPAVADVALSPAERAAHHRRRPGRGLSLARTWVRKEAALKATGTGLRVDPAGVRIVPGPGRRGFHAAAPGGAAIVGADLVLPGGWVGAVAVGSDSGGDGGRVVVHRNDGTALLRRLAAG